VSERTPIIAGNWKMHRDHLEAIQLVQKLAYHLQEDDYAGQEVVVCPPFVALRSVQTLLQSDKLPIALGAQDCHAEDEGAFTGEVSAPMLARLDVSYVIVGHSERRALFGETDEIVNAKIAAVQRHGMRPILCVGETLDEREAGTTEDKVTGQVQAGLTGLSPEVVNGQLNRDVAIKFYNLETDDEQIDEVDRSERHQLITANLDGSLHQQVEIDKCQGQRGIRDQLELRHTVTRQVMTEVVRGRVRQHLIVPLWIDDQGRSRIACPPASGEQHANGGPGHHAFHLPLPVYARSPAGMRKACARDCNAQR
jgi:triosephosphate isomerase